MQKILISACLLGEKVKYHGGDALVRHPLLSQWQSEGRLVSFCPEVAAGLSTPRPPAEIVGAGGGKSVLKGAARIVEDNGKDITQAYRLGAEMALQVARRHGIRVAILKDESPSCGSLKIYDGSFSGAKIEQMGITAVLLKDDGIAVFSEAQIEEAGKFLATLK